jgi:hypothetical protein
MSTFLIYYKTGGLHDIIFNVDYEDLFSCIDPATNKPYETLEGFGDIQSFESLLIPENYRHIAKLIKEYPEEVIRAFEDLCDEFQAFKLGKK